MSFDFSHDGHLFHLDTEGGQVHLQQLDQQPAVPQSLEPEETDDA